MTLDQEHTDHTATDPLATLYVERTWSPTRSEVSAAPRSAGGCASRALAGAGPLVRLLACSLVHGFLTAGVIAASLLGEELASALRGAQLLGQLVAARLT